MQKMHKFYREYSGDEFMKKKFVDDSFIKKLIAVLRDTGMDVYDKSMIELNAIGLLTIYGCREIIEYSNETVIIDLRDKYIEIKGDNLKINHYSSTSTEIGGEIKNISIIKL